MLCYVMLSYVCMYVCMYVYLILSCLVLPFLILSIFLSIYLPAYRSIYLAFLQDYLSIYPSLSLSIFPSIHLSICLSIYLSYLSIFLSFFLSHIRFIKRLDCENMWKPCVAELTLKTNQSICSYMECVLVLASRIGLGRILTTILLACWGWRECSWEWPSQRTLFLKFKVAKLLKRGSMGRCTHRPWWTGALSLDLWASTGWLWLQRLGGTSERLGVDQHCFVFLHATCHWLAVGTAGALCCDKWRIPRDIGGRWGWGDPRFIRRFQSSGWAKG